MFGGHEFAGLANQMTIDTSVQSHVGKLTLRETAQEMRRFQFYIGNDSGLTHLASLIIEKVLIISGGGGFRRFFPWPHAKNQHVIYKGMGCYDCAWQCQYSERYCLSEIEPRQVLAYFTDIANGTSEQERDLNPKNELYDVGGVRIGYRFGYAGSKSRN